MFESLTFLNRKGKEQLFGFMKVLGYFDASGGHDNVDGRGNPSPAVVVAGFLADRTKWLDFDGKWRSLLDRAGIRSFHMADFVAKKGEFRDWKKEQSDAFLAEVMTIISNAGLHGLGMALKRSDYNKVLLKHRVVKQILGEPYWFCVRRCWESGADWARNNNYDDAIEYIFESGDTYQHEIINGHTQMCKNEELRKLFRFDPGKITFANKDLTPLHAADLLAYLIYREEYRLTYMPNEPQRQTLITILQLGGTYKWYDESHLTEYVLEYAEKYQARKNNVA